MASKPTRSPAKIKMIMALCKRLGLDEDTRRILFESVTGKTHITGNKETGSQPMTNKELDAIINQLQRQSQLGVVRPGTDPQSRKIRSLWLELKGMGELRNASEEALLAYVVKRTAPVKSLDNLSPASASFVIEQLKKWADRVEARLIDEELSRRGLDKKAFRDIATKKGLLEAALEYIRASGKAA